MTLDATPDDGQLALAPLDEKVDHVRGSPAGRLIIEYGDYECPYSRQAFHAIQPVERQPGGHMRFAFRHFPLTSIHPHALAAAAAAEAGALQGRFWDMHELLFHRQKALEDSDLLGYAAQLGLDQAAGVLVREVGEGTPAAGAGVQPGDVLAKLDGKPLDTVEDFLGELRQHRPGDRVNLTIIRDGREQQMTATLADNPNG